MRKPAPLMCAALGLCPLGIAFGQFSDTFESYPLGEICGQGGWEEWVESTDVCGSVVDHFAETGVAASSGTQSFKILGREGGSTGKGDDTVRVFDISGGVWEFSIQTFVPENAVGWSMVIFLNEYPRPLGWTLELVLNTGNDTVFNFNNATERTNLIRGRWVELCARIDLDADIVDVWYDNVQFISGRSWAGGGSPTIQALDLYAQEPTGNGTSGTYFDDMLLVPGIGCCGQLCGDVNCDGAFDGADIDAFFQCLRDPAGWAERFPDCDLPCVADINGDGSADGADIDTFFSALIAGACP